MRKFWYLLLLPLMMGFAACGDDDDDSENGDVTKASIVGMWELSGLKGVLTEDGSSISFDVSPEKDLKEFRSMDIAEYTRLDFKSNGSMDGYEYVNGEWIKYTENARYSLNGNQLTLYGDRQTEKYTLVSLNSSNMVLHFAESDEDYKLEMDVTFKKVK